MIGPVAESKLNTFFQLIGLVLFMLLAGILSGCGSTLKPFGKSSSASGRTAPPIIITPMQGIPTDKAKFLIRELSESAAKNDIAIVDGNIAGGYKLNSAFKAVFNLNGAVVNYSWNLHNDKGQAVYSATGSEVGRPAINDPWGGVDPDSLRRIAADISHGLAQRLGQMGYATRTSSILPPAANYTRAGPNAEQQIDYETYYGPGAVPVASEMPSVDFPIGQNSAAISDPALLPQAPSNQQVAAIAEAPPAQPKTKTVTPAKKPTKQPKIRAVAVTKVTGAAGRGNKELLLAMRKVLAKAGWPVVNLPQPDALQIIGDVGLGTPSNGQQKVVLAWQVKMPDGKNIGTIKQANNVPAGSLDKGWGKNADYAAQAAAHGIYNLVDKAR